MNSVTVALSVLVGFFAAGTVAAWFLAPKLKAPPRTMGPSSPDRGATLTYSGGITVVNELGTVISAGSTEGRFTGINANAD
jgi:hypothetical protein